MGELSKERQAEVRRDRQLGWTLLTTGSASLTVAAFLEHRGPKWLFWGLVVLGAACGAGFRWLMARMAKKSRRDVARE